MINIGVIGYGYWGPNLVRSFIDTPGLNVVGVADSDAKKLERVGQRFPQLKATVHSQDLLADQAIDAIAIATPVHSHFQLGMAALKAGKHVWLEKPMAHSLEQASALFNEANLRRRVLFVDYTFIYTGAVRKMRELLSAGELGSIHYYDSTRINLGMFQRDANVIADLAAHDFAILDYLFEEPPLAVSAIGGKHYADMPENLAYINLFYDSGMIAHTNVSWLAPVKVRQILIGGSRKMVVYNDLEPSEKIKVYDKGIILGDDPEKIYQLHVGYRSGDMVAPQLDATEALRVAAGHFAACIEHGNPPLTGGILGLRVAALIEAATQSMHGQGCPVNIPVL